MKNIIKIALLDLMRVTKDKQAILWMLIMPFGFAFLFGNMFGDPSNRKVWIPVFNHDQQELSTIFIEQLKDDRYNINIRSATDEQWVQNWSRALIIPATFTEDVLNGNEVELTLVKGKGNFEHTLSAETHLINTLVRFVGSLASADVVNKRWTKNTKERFLQELEKPNILQMEEKTAFTLRPPPHGYGFTLPAYLIMFVMMNTLLYGGITLAQDRENHVMKRLAATPTSQNELILGKLFGRILIPMVQASLLLAIGNLALGVSLGDSPWVLMPVVICFACCCGSLGVLYGSIFDNEQQVMGVSILTTMTFSALGGCWWPMEIVPDTMKMVAAFTPTYWGLQGLHDVMAFGKSIDGVIWECMILILFTIVFTAFAIPLLRKKAF